MNKKVIITAGVVFIALCLFFYMYLGGTAEVTISKRDINNYQFVGKDYSGRYRSEELENIYFDLKEKKESGAFDGELVVINYPMEGDSTENGFVHQFLGIQLNAAMEHIPSTYQRLFIESRQTLEAKIPAHNLVMPSPEDIENDIRSMARAENLALVNYTIEIYVSDRELLVQIPILSNGKEK